MKNQILITALSLLLFLGSGGLLFAQQGQQQGQIPKQNETPEITETVLEDFSDAYKNVQEISQKINDKMSTLIQDSTFSNEKFQSLYGQYQQSQKAPKNLSNDKQKEFNELMKQIQQLQKEQQEKMVSAIEEAELEVQQFNGILQKLQQDSDLYDRFMNIHQEQNSQ